MNGILLRLYAEKFSLRAAKLHALGERTSHTAGVLHKKIKNFFIFFASLSN